MGTMQWRWLGFACALLACSGDDAGGAAGADPNNPFGNSTGQGGPGSGNTGSGSGSGAGSGAPGSGGPGSGGGSCTDGEARTSTSVPRVILVVDGSCSMSTNYPADGLPSAIACLPNPAGRWTALRTALLDPARGVVPRLQNQVEFGLAVYGTEPECPIPGQPIQPALMNGAAIDAAMPQIQPGMFTPTGPALDWVMDNMITGEVLDSLNGPEIVVLATDGEPNSCGDAEPNYQPSVDAVMKGRSLNVTTYVVSLADATGQFHDHLQELANLGSPTGAGRLYEPGTPEELAADLEILIGGAIGCDLALNGYVQEGSECAGTVTLNGEELECNGPDGWVLTDPRHIRVQGAACERLMTAGQGALVASFPCGTFEVD